MKKTLIISTLLVLMNVVFANNIQGKIERIDYSTELKSFQQENYVFEEENYENIRFSIRGGVHDWRDAEFVDSSFGLQLEMDITLGQSPFDLNLRGFYQETKYEDTFLYQETFENYLFISSNLFSYEEFYNEEVSAYGFSAQLVFNILRGEIINPYIALGVMYEKTVDEYDAYSIYGYNIYSIIGNDKHYNDYWSHEKESEKGFTYIVRLGAEVEYYLLYARFEIAALGEIYDYDDSVQAEISGILGLNITENLRLEVAANYFSKWEEYYLTGGVSIGF